jgi:CheY-like chemotaxis protein
MYTVLLVEGRRSEEAVADALRRSGFQVVRVPTPDGALPMLRGPVLPDAVVLDLEQPEAGRLRRELRHHPRLGVVDLGPPDDPSADLLRPFSPYRLTAAVRGACEAGGSDQSRARAFSVGVGASSKSYAAH